MGLKNNILASMCTAALVFSCYHGTAEAMSINVADGDVREVLRSIAKVEGINLVIDDSVTGKVTASLKDVSPLQAIRQIALARGFSVTDANGTVIVSSKSAIDAGFSSLHVIPLKYANPADVVSAVRAVSNGGSADRQNKGYDESVADDRQSVAGSGNMAIWVDSGTNSLLLYGTDSQIGMARELVSKLDIPARQVMLEAKIVSMEKSAAKSLGVS